MNYTIFNEDCLIKLKDFEDNCIDAIITDPPYEISFMSKGWDGTGIAFNTEVWKECLRVLKPGGHILAFGGTRTYHRMTVAIEDAGFEIRDCIFWCYGSGFPKSHNIGKAVDKIQGNEREVVGKRKLVGTTLHEGNFRKNGDEIELTKGNSPYEGWGTALKPAVEPVVMGRKPFKSSVAQNVLEWGTGGINIDGCRVGTEEIYINKLTEGASHFGDYNGGSAYKTETTQGRFPANLILDEEAGKLLDEQSGIDKPKKTRTSVLNGKSGIYEGGFDKNGIGTWPGDNGGGASRFFYCPKTSKKERNEGCDELEDKETNDGRKAKASPNYQTVIAQKGKNHHPTVKPSSLLQYLIRLITPKGGTVLDPFMGSGSTGKAAMKEGMDFVGIEKEEEYFEIAKARIEWEKQQNTHHKFFE